MQRWAVARGLTAFTVFADIASAFYGAVTQSVACTGQAADQGMLDRLTERLQLSPGDVAELRRHLLEPSELSHAGANPWVEAIATKMVSQNWFVVKHDSVAVTTARGTRPGSSFADVLFAMLVPRVLRSRDAARASVQQHSRSPRLPWDGCITLAGCDADADEIEIHDVVWADDLAVPRICDTPKDARAAVARETGVLADAMGEFGLRLTYGAGKTASVVTIRGAGSRAVRRMLSAHDGCAGSVSLFREHGERVQLPLVASYRHLGTMQAPAGAMGPELKYRVSQAHGQEGRRKLYRSRSVCVKRKALLLNAMVFAKLLHGAGTWPPLQKQEQQIFDTAVWTFSRAILCIPRGGDQSLTGLACCALTGLLPPHILLRKARLLYLRQLVAAGPKELWAIIRADRPYAEMLMSDLVWVFQWNHRMLEVGHPYHGWDDWLRLMRARPRVFKGTIKRACALDLVRICIIAALDGLHRGLAALAGVRHTATAPGERESYPELCVPCARAFRSRLAWSAHAARLHGYRSKAFLTGKGRTCLACGKLFANEGRLRRHLISVPWCLTNWGRYEPDGPEPTHVPGRLARPDISEDEPGVAVALLEELRTLSDEHVTDETVVWSWVTEHIEPLSVLRATVRAWQEESIGCPWKVETAENILLLLDPAVSAETYPEPRCPSKPGIFDVPSWSPLKGLCFVSSGDCLCFALPEPPALTFDLHSPTSVPLRSALALQRWTEDTCRVIVECASAARSQPISLSCPGLWTPLPTLLEWAREVGFCCDAAGMYSP